MVIFSDRRWLLTVVSTDALMNVDGQVVPSSERGTMNDNDTRASICNGADIWKLLEFVGK